MEKVLIHLHLGLHKFDNQVLITDIVDETILTVDVMNMQQSDDQEGCCLQDIHQKTSTEKISQKISAKYETITLVNAHFMDSTFYINTSISQHTEHINCQKLDDTIHNWKCSSYEQCIFSTCTKLGFRLGSWNDTLKSQDLKHFDVTKYIYEK